MFSRENKNDVYIISRVFFGNHHEALAATLLTYNINASSISKILLIKLLKLAHKQVRGE